MRSKLVVGHWPFRKRFISEGGLLEYRRLFRTHDIIPLKAIAKIEVDMYNRLKLWAHNGEPLLVAYLGPYWAHVVATWIFHQSRQWAETPEEEILGKTNCDMI